MDSAHGTLKEPPDAGKKEMSWGRVLYRAATFAGLIVVLTAINYFYNVSQDRPLVPLVPLLFAGLSG